jgi:hypothetical protein
LEAFKEFLEINFKNPFNQNRLKMLRALSPSLPNLTQRLMGGPEGQHDPARRSLHGRGGVDRRDLADGEIPGGMATTVGFLVARRARRARRWRHGSSRRGSSSAMADGDACMAVVAPSLATAVRERSAVVQWCQTEHGKAKKGRRNGAGRG